MPLYEHILLGRQDISAQQFEGLVETYQAIIKDNGGSIEKTENWGIKNLAYKIKKNRKAHFALMNIDAPHEAVAEMERQMGLSTDVIRFLTLRMDELDPGPSAMMKRGDRDDRRGGRGDRDRGPRGDRDRGPRGDRDRDRGPRTEKPKADEQDAGKAAQAGKNDADTSKADTNTPETSKAETDKADTSTPDTSKAETDKADTSKADADTSKADADTSKTDTSKADASTPDTSKAETDKADTSKEEE